MRTKIPKSYKVKGRIWLYPGQSANWHFLSIPKKESGEIKEAYKSMRKGWGSLPVSVTKGKTTWTTSIFPDSKSGTYILPLKAEIRRKENLFDNDICTVKLLIMV